ncbi:MAG: winged helix-turn-helix transcriptional regulator, partial [Myxococcales bacterium]|nr:winged helix-turn-helix transcriptional regulator [Myxococcales bacterium]
MAAVARGATRGREVKRGGGRGAGKSGGTLAEQVAEQLKREILSGAYAPGDKLKPELTLAEELGVNRFTVREAMHQLEQLRLIERRPGAGTLVLDYSQNASVDVIEYLVLSEDGVVNTTVLDNLLETALMLSADLAALAAERRTETDLRIL